MNKNCADFEMRALRSATSDDPLQRKKLRRRCLVKNQVQTNANPDSGGRLKEFFEQEAGEAARVVAEDAVFFKEIVEDYPEA